MVKYESWESYSNERYLFPTQDQKAQKRYQTWMQPTA